jgi:protocatechuate 3,4-dioxygenase beta subunit
MLGNVTKSDSSDIRMATEANVVMANESRGQFMRRSRSHVWAIIAIAVLGSLTACGGQIMGGHEQTAAAETQPVSLQPDVQPTPTAAAPAPGSTQSAPVQAPSAQSAPTPTSGKSAAAATGCASPAAPTPALTEGPFFKAGSPERSSMLDSNLAGTKLVLSGYVLTANCEPIPHALLDFWQADSSGNYDNSGYALRGHQFTDTSGRYQLTTIVPGLYPGRTEHIHVKVQAPNLPVLTTQLFFPGVAGNQADGIFDARLLISVQETPTGLAGTFNFVVNE